MQGVVLESHYGGNGVNSYEVDPTTGLGSFVMNNGSPHAPAGPCCACENPPIPGSPTVVATKQSVVPGSGAVLGLQCTISGNSSFSVRADVAGAPCPPRC